MSEGTVRVKIEPLAIRPGLTNENCKITGFVVVTEEEEDIEKEERVATVAVNLTEAPPEVVVL